MVDVGRGRPVDACVAGSRPDATDSQADQSWDNVSSFSHDSALIARAAAALGRKKDRLDALFVQAAAINP
jgi:hypothetical protein